MQSLLTNYFHFVLSLRYAISKIYFLTYLTRSNKEEIVNLPVYKGYQCKLDTYDEILPKVTA